MAHTRVLMATDVPFWRCETGAQQRILHLVTGISGDAFGDRACDVRTFYVGIHSEEDEQAVTDLGLDVHFHSSDGSSDGIRKRMKWHMEGTIHLVRQTFRGRKDIADVDQPLKLDEFRWPNAINAFAEEIESFKPDVVLCQYLTTSFLLEALTADQRAKVRCVVDTHDVLSMRQEQFEQFGFSHWISISPHAEADELQKFDGVLSIIDHERPVFESMAPDANVMTVSHSMDPITSKQAAIDRPDGDALLTVGYLGSSNHSNGHALVKFIRKVWKPLRIQNADVNLVIAGGICDWLMFHEESRFASDESMSLWIELSTDSRVKLMGKVDSPADFYREIDVAVNPVEFGTGLKIKTCEAMAYGVPSVVTGSGARAIPPEANDAVFPCKSISDMVPAIFAMSIDREQVSLMRQSARDVAESVFTNDAAYGEFVNWLSNC